ncbi:unnamed protein product [Bursaphelenchus xylophilus]|uniref:(pine wood nematode) hypothetical protein n=1 Tax=Bursaphelenchus xylophilus TaxID=6326 RepID=A0A1I7RM80_BURXY|nr:unnamed protein product [Bursaphelenchus xylophilus]CAG9118278.1 unnamed protein product [Bursaphelenchus xylophilus]
MQLLLVFMVLFALCLPSDSTAVTQTSKSTTAHWCVDGAINCAQFTQYCKPGTQYTAFMLKTCIQTCGVCKYGQ